MNMSINGNNPGEPGLFHFPTKPQRELLLIVFSICCRLTMKNRLLTAG